MIQADMENSGKLKLLDPEQIALRRIPLEDSIVTKAKNKNWYCSYCSQHFSGEMTFMKHYCEPKRRAQELMTPTGQAAYGYYKDWMKKKKYSAPAAAAFMESKYYRSFINFSKLVVDANIPSPDKYIQLMVEHNILPILWCKDSTYSIYVDWVDRLSDPLDQVQKSINYLFDICEKESVSITDVMNHIGPERILNLIRQRRLSPWLLFCSQKFGQILKKLDASQLRAFNSVINASYWAGRFQKEKSTTDSIKTIILEIGL